MRLFQPITINGMKIENRIVYPAVQMNMGLTNRRARAFYAERAKGGAGLIITANVAIDNLAGEELWGGETELKAFVSRLRQLTGEIHAAGAKIGLQLWQSNPFPSGRGTQIAGEPAEPGGALVAPSARENMREITIPEIEAVIYRFAKAARNVREAGFDCVEIHGAHGYLPCQFTSPELNRRTDIYGGSPAGRMKFGRDMVTAVRAWVGADFPIIFRLGAMDVDDKIHPESLAYAQELEKAGVDCLDVSTCGTGKYPPSPPKRAKMGTWVFLAEAIKQKVGIPVIAVGRINTAEVAEKVLADGQADMVAVARQLIADPYWPQKIREGRSAEITSCLSCSINCYSPVFKRKIPEGSPLCRVNPEVGKEWEDKAGQGV